MVAKWKGPDHILLVGVILPGLTAECSHLWNFGRTHLPLRDPDGLPEHNPSDTLTERGCGQGARIGPVVSAGRQQALGVKAAELGLGVLGRMGTQELAQSSYQGGFSCSLLSVRCGPLLDMIIQTVGKYL